MTIHGPIEQETLNLGRSVEGAVRRATATQTRLCLIDQLSPSAPVCNEAVVLWLDGVLDHECMRTALSHLLARYDALRTRFVERGRTLYAEAKAETFTLHKAQLAADEAAASEQLARFARQRFDLERAPLFRAGLFRASSERHALVLVAHRAAIDEVSLTRLVPRALGVLYTAGTPESASYGAFLERAHAARSSQDAARDLQYWRDLLDGAPRALSLPIDRSYPPRPSLRCTSAEHPLSSALRDRVDALASEQGVRPSDVVCAAFAAQLMRYSGASDVVLGVPVDLRATADEREGLIGCCTESSIVRARFDATPSFEQLLREVSRQRGRAEAPRALPFGALVEALGGARDPARHPIFQAMFVDFESTPRAVRFGELAVRAERVPLGFATLDLKLALADTAQGYHLVLDGNADVFEADHLARMLTHLAVLLEHAAGAPHTSIGKLRMIGASELETVRAFSCGPRSSRQLQLFHTKLWQCARAFERATALRSGAAALDYAQVYGRVAELAARLIDAGVKPGDFVLVPGLRDPIDTVVGMLGVLASGGAFVALDSGAPAARRKLMIEDSGARFALCEAHGSEDLAELPARITRIAVGSGSVELGGAGLTPMPEVRSLTPDHPAYLLYTSGSTGAPKGVVVSHANLTHQLHARLARYDDPPGRALAPYSLAFDSALASLSWTLAVGGELHLLDDDARHDVDRIEAALAREQITHFDAVPSLYAALLSRLEPGALPALRVVVCGGEALPASVVERHWRTLPHVRLYNEYGPTEATVFATVHELSRDVHERPVPIGTPIAHCECWVIDAAGGLAPIGHSGELYIGGDGVARGYHDRPTETARRFVMRTVFDGDEARALYRTGDRCRYREDGVLEYLGRVDDQVQIRGHRVEIGEIEAALCSLPSVADAAVALQHGDRGDARLVAYLVRAKGHELELSALVAGMRERLPSYMVPTSYAALDDLPRNANGKTDRAALLGLAAVPLSATPTNVPQSALERELVAIFEDLIGAVGIGVTDNFFDHGGHSLLAVQAIELIERRTGARLSIAEFGRNPTARGIALAIEGHGRTSSGTRCLDVIRAEGELVPLVFVGSVSQARRVAQHLAPNRKVIGLNLFGLHDPGRIRDVDIDRLVEHYITELRTILPHGPYALGGYCDDAKVAIAMAERLRAVGEDVRLMVMIDALFYLERKLDAAGAKTPANKPPALTKRRASAKWLRHRVERLMTDGLSDLRRALAGRELSLRKRLGLPLPLTLEHTMLFNNYRSALDAYAAPMLEEHVVHYVSEEWKPTDHQRSVLHNLQMHVVPGFHHTMFEGASLDVLAAAIDRDLSAADARGSASPAAAPTEAVQQRLGLLLSFLLDVLGYAATL